MGRGGRADRRAHAGEQVRSIAADRERRRDGGTRGREQHLRGLLERRDVGRGNFRHLRRLAGASGSKVPRGNLDRGRRRVGVDVRHRAYVRDALHGQNPLFACFGRAEMPKLPEKACGQPRAHRSGKPFPTGRFSSRRGLNKAARAAAAKCACAQLDFHDCRRGESVLQIHRSRAAARCPVFCKAAHFVKRFCKGRKANFQAFRLAKASARVRSARKWDPLLAGSPAGSV
jgi:hypothetical protein